MKLIGIQILNKEWFDRQTGEKKQVEKYNLYLEDNIKKGIGRGCIVVEAPADDLPSEIFTDGTLNEKAIELIDKNVYCCYKAFNGTLYSRGAIQIIT